VIRLLVLQEFSLRARARCKGLHRNGDTWVRVDITVSAAGGVIRLMDVTDIVVEKGAPIDDSVRQCLADLFKMPVILDHGPALANTPLEYQAQYAGKWARLPDLSGTFAAGVAFADQFCAKAKSQTDATRGPGPP
jgi:hypothetical protein